MCLSSGRLEDVEIGGGSLSRAERKDVCWGGRGARFEPKE